MVGTAAAPELVLDLHESFVLLEETAAAEVAMGALEGTTGALVAIGAELETTALVTSATDFFVETTAAALVATTAEEAALVAETTADEATGEEVPPVVPSQTAGPGMVYEVKLP